MSLSNYTDSNNSPEEDGTEEEIFEYVQDERIL